MENFPLFVVQTLSFLNVFWLGQMEIFTKPYISSEKINKQVCFFLLLLLFNGQKLEIEYFKRSLAILELQLKWKRNSGSNTQWLFYVEELVTYLYI